ncbi:DUF2726 domain-containing protein [Arenicella xantha]|uniref:Topoisomerase-like DNA binding C4 zinc finger protein n=1 Tax=Arenicella xantha TaxID=644221 RepID=A0A395JMV2_9GAMM|nr:DUF2726 domain-containing protein [Arenicella xantha]RBP52994.1 topoisomerase-like DNA binding C4 zinc finger protein [Arenicella xantha]
MDSILIAAFTIVIVLIAFAIIVKQSPRKLQGAGNLQYQKLNILFTAAERSFLGVLKLSLTNKFEVFGKVRVADVITPRKGQDRSAWQKAFNKISSKHFDFIICDKDDLSPICAIELNDKSHNSKKGKERDRFLESACKSAGMPLVQIPAKATYQVTDINEVLSAHLPQIESIKAKIAPEFAGRKSAPEIASVKSTSEKVCPKCSSSMAMKIAKKGKNVGKEFWACSAFPKCRHIEAKDGK